MASARLRRQKPPDSVHRSWSGPCNGQERAPLPRSRARPNHRQSRHEQPMKVAESLVLLASTISFSARPKADDCVEATPEHALPSKGISPGPSTPSCGSSMTALLMRSRSSLFRYTTHANAITSPSLSCTACGKDVTLGLSVVADRVGSIQSAVAKVGVAPFLGQPLVGVEVGTGNLDNNGVNVVDTGPPLG